MLKLLKETPFFGLILIAIGVVACERKAQARALVTGFNAGARVQASLCRAEKEIAATAKPEVENVNVTLA